MKKYVLFFLFLIIAGSVMAATNPPACPNGCNPKSTELPINAGVIYLLVAGLIVGIVAIVRSKKLAKV